MRRNIVLTILILALLQLAVPLAGLAAADSNPALLIQRPALSKTQIAFVYAGDIWTVNADGSGRSALTSGGGFRSPIFAPAGDQIYALKGETLLRERPKADFTSMLTVAMGRT